MLALGLAMQANSTKCARLCRQSRPSENGISWARTQASPARQMVPSANGLTDAPFIGRYSLNFLFSFAPKDNETSRTRNYLIFSQHWQLGRLRWTMPIECPIPIGILMHSFERTAHWLVANETQPGSDAFIPFGSWAPVITGIPMASAQSEFTYRPAGSQLVGLKLKHKLIYSITCHPAHLSFCHKHLPSGENSNEVCITCLVFFYFSC